MALLPTGLARARLPLVAGGALGAGLGALRWMHRSPVRCEEGRVKDPKKLENTESGFNSLKAKLPSLPVMPSLASLSDSFDSLLRTFTALHSELVNAPSSHRFSVLASATDPAVHPELEYDATVRLSASLSHSERAFVRNRRERMRASFAKLMGVPEEEIDLRDVPVIAVAGSGGGYRAMVNSLGAVKGMEDAGVWDCVMYASAVSGSCWALNVLYTIGEGNVDKTIAHIKDRIQTPFLDPTTLELLVDPRTSAYLLSGAILKEATTGGDLSLVDLYGTFVSSRLYVPTDPIPLLPANLKISSQRSLTDSGANPLPLYCVIRHEVPHADDVAAAKVVADSTEASGNSLKQDEETDRKAREEREKERLKGSRWMWAELSPYEFGFEELGAWIPTWSVGRQFLNGKNVNRAPELSLTIFSGIFASAFCATLYSYFKEVRPILSNLPYFTPTEAWLLSNYESQLDTIHPFPPAELPNFLKGLEGKLPRGTPEGLTKLDTLGFIDAGANLNIPYVPLFRRDCDIILAFDASADSQDLWFSRAEEYAAARDLRTWPRVHSASLFDQSSIGDSEKSASDQAASKVDEAKVQELATHHPKVDEGGEAQPTAVNPQRVPEGSAPHSSQSAMAEKEERMPTSTEGEPRLGRCNIWIGSTKDEDASCRNDNPTVEEVMERDGIVLAYYPLMAGPELTNPAEVWSTWKFEYTKEETEKLVNLSRANFRAGEDQLRTTLKGIWMRKRKQRLEET